MEENIDSDIHWSEVLSVIEADIVPQGSYIKVVEEPASKALRFRYECEGRSAGSIPGANSTAENKTFPTIEIVGCTGTVVVVVSCVTKDPPYRPHPHDLVGRNCKNGVCRVQLTGESLRAEFSNLGIRCVKRNDIKKSLELREKMNVDPYKTKFAHKDQKSGIDLNAVRLCFQAFEIRANGQKAMQPIVSEPIYDKKAMSDLVIHGLCGCSAKVGGGQKLVLLCEKVSKDDIKVKFFENDENGQEKWKDYAIFQETDIHKQTAIMFKTPRYYNTDITHNVQVFIQLERPSDGATSEALPFEFYPDAGMRTFSHILRKLKRKEDLEIFQQILSLDSETTATKYSCPPLEFEGENEDNETFSESESRSSRPQSTDTMGNEYEVATKKRTESEADLIDDIEDVADIEVELEVPQISFPVVDESTQTSTPMEDILKLQILDSPRQLSTVDKITEWMRSSEFERTDSLTVENGDIVSLTPNTNITNLSVNHNTTILTVIDDDKNFSDLIGHDTEYANKNHNPQFQSHIQTLDDHISKEISDSELPQTIEEIDPPSASAQPSVDLDENFDETATYTSLQKAFTNPINIPQSNFNINFSNHFSKWSNEDEGLVVLTNPPAPKIRVNTVQTPPSPPSPPLPLPPRTPSPVFDYQLPPLPPKRKSSNELESSEALSCSSRERSRNSSLNSRPPSQIIIMRTPEQSPTKRTPTPTSSPKKKQGFFSRMFSRPKSKSESSRNDENQIKSTISLITTPNGSREPSLGNFSIADAKRSSIRSIKSAQGLSPRLSPQNSTYTNKTSRPVGRSISSVSGKRPAHLNADVIHIPLKDDSSSPYRESNAITFGHTLDRKTLSTLQLADIPICDGNMELVAIADRQSIKNLCEGDFGIILDPGVDLAEAEHFALYTSAPTQNRGMNNLDNYQNFIESNELVSADDIARRLAEANNIK